MFGLGMSTLKRFMGGTPHWSRGTAWGGRSIRDNAHWTGCNPHSPWPCASLGGGERRIGSEAEPEKKREGLVLFVVESVFFTEALMVLYFGCVSKRALITEQCLPTAGHPGISCLPHCPTGEEAGGAQEVTQWGQLTPADPRGVPHHVSHTQCIHLGEEGMFSVMTFIFHHQCSTWWSPAFLENQFMNSFF